MREQDRPYFAEAAQPGKIHDLGLYILVRDSMGPRQGCLDFVGQPGHLPKGADCKAKTADRNTGGYSHAGLVVDPTLCPGSFSPSRAQEALKKWEELLKRKTLRLWRVNDNGKPKLLTEQPWYCVNTDTSDVVHYGCLLFRHHYLYSDYDIYDIFPPVPQEMRSPMATVVSRPWAKRLDRATRGRYLTRVAEFVNAKIGAPMVQHGEQNLGGGAIPNETIEVFTPLGYAGRITGAIDRFLMETFGRGSINVTEKQSGVPVPRGGSLRVIRGGRS